MRGTSAVLLACLVVQPCGLALGSGDDSASREGDFEAASTSSSSSYSDASMEPAGDAMGKKETQPIRPGARVVAQAVGGPSGTFNFVFRNRLTGSLGIGVAAHVVDEMGTAVFADIDGHLEKVGSICVFPEGYVDNRPERDFALACIDKAYEGRVSPSVDTLGGPTSSGRAERTQRAAFVGQTLGHTLAVRHGIISQVDDNLTRISINAFTPPPPPIQLEGDSGAPLLVLSGGARKAVGITTSRVLLAVDPNPQSPDVDALAARGPSWPTILEILGGDWELVHG